MRVFSNFDKTFIKNIIELQAIGELLLYPNKFFKGLIHTSSRVLIVGRTYNYELKDGESHYHKIEIQAKGDNQAEDYFKFTGAFYAANDLIEYLLKNGYLLRHEGSRFLGAFINGIPDDEEVITKKEIYVNKTLAEFLDKLQYDYIPTEALKDLAGSKFRTKDERHSRTTRSIAIASIIIAFIGLFLNYYLNKDKTTLEKSQTIVIDTNSIKQILKTKSNTVNIDTNSLNFLINRFSKKSKQVSNKR